MPTQEQLIECFPEDFPEDEMQEIILSKRDWSEEDLEKLKETFNREKKKDWIIL